jgi:hypothetical protein
MTSHVGMEVPSFGELAPGVEVPNGLEALVRRGLEKMAADRISSVEYVQALDEILRANGVEVTPAPLSVRASQSIGIPVGPFAFATPVPGRLTPFPAARSKTAAAMHVAPAASTPVPSLSATATKPVDAKSRIARPRWIVLAGIALVATIALAIGWSGRARRNHHEPTASEKSVAAVPTPVAVPPSPAPEHDAKLKAALHELQDGTTCPERKKAIAKLVDLRDTNAVPAIKKARAKGKANACLRTAVDQAIKALDGRI